MHIAKHMHYSIGLVLLNCCFKMTPALAATPPATGLGHVAQTLLNAPVNYAFTFMTAVCFILGGSFFFAGIIKYFEHRRNPMVPPISTVVFLFIMGSILICLALLSLFAEAGIGMRYML